jgi:ribosomal-protein-alanine N-acetyltransferase
LSSVGDFDAILDIERASFTNPWTREMYLAEFENQGVSCCFVVRDPAGRILGFCSFWRVLDELHINNLAIAPEERGRGAGTALLQRVLQEGERLGARRATLEVRASNLAALRLYGRLGFSVGGVRPGYYTNPIEDALILWREDHARS